MVAAGFILCAVGVGLITVRYDDGPVQHLPWIVLGLICIVLGVLCFLEAFL